MKKRLLPLAALALCSMSAFAQYAPSASTQVYDFAGYSPEVIFPLFKAALDDGRKYPTDAEFEAAGINLMDLHFVRSHVRPRSIMVDHAKDVNQDVYPNRNLWMNIPMGIGKDRGGYPNNNLMDDTFTGWNYTNIFGSWNQPFFRAPAVWIDAAHKNGTDIYSGIMFFDTTGGRGQGSGDYLDLISRKNADGTFEYVEPIINALMYFGSDGINYNWEASGYNNSNTIKFHQALYKEAERQGFDNFHIGLYTNESALTMGNAEALLGRNGVKTCDAFLNYAGGDFSSQISNSARNAENIFGTAEGLYQGAWIVGMNLTWSNLVRDELAKKVGIVLWGEHAESRLHSYNKGSDPVNFQDNYQKLQDRFFSGGYRNPAVRPTPTNYASWQSTNPAEDGLRTFQGLAEYVPERTAIQHNLPFTTFFNTGAGERYNYKGKKTFGSWYNMGQQDVVPTYRWLVFDKGTTNAVTEGLPEFTSSDAYIGGSCIRLTNTQPVDIQLYRCALTCSAGDPKATIALKRFEGAPEGTVSVIVKKQGSDEWLETEFANVKSNAWEEQTVSLNGIAQGDVIEYIGLRTNAGANGLLVGQLTLSDDLSVIPAKLKNVLVDVKEETLKSLSVKLCWDVDAEAKTREAHDLLYNDEAGIDHFEVLYKNGADGRVSEVARTTTWSSYIGNIPMAEGEEPYIGVRAASVDGKNYSEIVWVNVPRAEASQLPAATEDDYPASYLNPDSEGAATAIANRWIKTLRAGVGTAETPIADLPVIHTATSSPADHHNYVLADKAITAAQGQSVKMVWAAGSQTDGFYYCTGRGYADWDCNHDFNGEEAPYYDYADPIDASNPSAGKYDGVYSGGNSRSDSNPQERLERNAKLQREVNDEVIWRLGRTNLKNPTVNYSEPYSITFQIPEDAVPGESRVRLVFSDAWFPHPGASGPTAKGFTIDIPLEITGTNPARGAVEDTHDQGLADEPVNLEGIVVGIKGVSSEISKAALNGRELQLANAEKVWVYNAEGKLMIFAKNADAVDMQSYAPGTYIVRMQNGQVIRNAKVIVK